jgi:alkylation response protein AidB-like acyl-CoA dehydrogenase
VDFSLTEDQQSIRDGVLEYCSQFSDEYWLERDHEGVFPHDFHKSMADSGWLGVAMPEAIGAEGEGFKIILHGLNPERILLGAEAIGLGRVAIKRAARYAKERIVFDRPIGMNQGIQHPLAKCWAQEYHLERYLREVLIPRTAPVSPHMILNFLAEKVLDLPKSY